MSSFCVQSTTLFMLFYLSSTGNTLWAAKTIAQATGDRLVNIAEALQGDCTFTLASDERIGFAFPVHGWRPPVLFRDFIRYRMRLLTGTETDTLDKHYVYALCTAGDDIGETMRLLEADLAVKQLRPQAECSLIMPESYVGLPFMDVDKKAKEKKKKEEAALQLSRFIEIVKAMTPDRSNLVLGHWPRINSRLLGGLFLKYLVTDRPFHVNSSRCVKCGICADVCPVADIVGGLGHEPVWRHNDSCLTCFSCYHHCPHHAIEYGGRTKHKGQYFYNRNKL